MRLFSAFTPSYRDSNGQPLTGSIAAIETVRLGGLEQVIILRGQSIHNPVLLFLHGGPGTPETAWLNAFNANLESHFTVVGWEQRGGGKSYRANIPPESMTLEQFIQDAHELTGLLKQRFPSQKIYLVGHSWGTLLGAHLVSRYPEDYAAYIGVSQVANTAESELLSYQWVLETARQRQNERAARELEKIGAPVNGQYASGQKGTHLERKWVREFGGALHGKSAMPLLKRKLIQSPIYTVAEALNYFKGEAFSLRYLWSTVLNARLCDTLLDFNLPVYICQGLHDYQTVYSVTKCYYEQIHAPRKGFYTFENSAHGTLFEEPQKFLQIMLEIAAECEQPQARETGA